VNSTRKKNCLNLMHCSYLTTKTILRLKEKEQRKWTQNGLSNLPLFGLPDHALTQGYVFTRDWTIFFNPLYFGKCCFDHFKLKWRFVHDIEVPSEKLLRTSMAKVTKEWMHTLLRFEVFIHQPIYLRASVFLCQFCDVVELTIFNGLNQS
jgi:hypothetical protein